MGHMADRNTGAEINNNDVNNITNTSTTKIPHISGYYETRGGPSEDENAEQVTDENSIGEQGSDVTGTEIPYIPGYYETNGGPSEDENAGPTGDNADKKKTAPKETEDQNTKFFKAVLNAEFISSSNANNPNRTEVKNGLQDLAGLGERINAQVQHNLKDLEGLGERINAQVQHNLREAGIYSPYGEAKDQQDDIYSSYSEAKDQQDDYEYNTSYDQTVSHSDVEEIEYLIDDLLHTTSNFIQDMCHLFGLINDLWTEFKEILE